MTPNLNHEDAAHLLNIIRGEQVQSSLMSALAKQHAEQVTKLVLEAKSAHKAMGELYKHLCQKISEATKDGAEKAVAQFSLDANSAALKDAKNISEDLKRSSDLLSEAAVSLAQVKKRSRIRTLLLTALLAAINIGVALGAANYFAATTDKRVEATVTYDAILARGIEFTFQSNGLAISLPTGVRYCSAAQAKNRPQNACVFVPQAR
ncbi:MAG: hypothetical protein ACK5YU_05980 [Burkholderiales bacterium]|jgi:hypothetical protein|nr:hypothetical protein [Betaproteobacteria bacterium]